MSAFGTKRTCQSRSAMSAFEGKADADQLVEILGGLMNWFLGRYPATTAIGVISTMISGTAKQAAVSNVLAGKSLPYISLRISVNRCE